jgi:hypothetical protein
MGSSHDQPMIARIIPSVNNPFVNTVFLTCCVGLSLYIVELSVLFAVARSVDTQTALRPFVQRAAAVTDRTLADLPFWPPSADRDDATSSSSRGSAATGGGGNGASSLGQPRIASPSMLRSPGLLAAVLAKHRTALIEAGGGSGNFWDQIEFYTEIIDGLVGWLYGGMKRLRRYDDVAGRSITTM